MNRIKWSDISKYRGELFGLAIISVIILHYFGQFNSGDSNRLVFLIAKVYNGAVGSVGVDIFVLLSGYGLYYSLNNRKELRSYYEKRFQRVLFPYLVVGLLFWVIIDFILLKESMGQFVFDYSLLSFWMRGVQTFWYIAFICLMYILSPVIYKLTTSRIRFMIVLIFSCLISVIVYIISSTYFSNVEIALQRIPSFFVGMLCGNLSIEESKLQEKRSLFPNWLILILIISVPVKVVVGALNFPFARMFNGYYALFLIVLYIMLRKEIVKQKFSLFSWFATIGKYSLELYIVHMATRKLMGTLEIQMKNPFIYCIHVIIVIPLAMCLAQLQKFRLFNR